MLRLNNLTLEPNEALDLLDHKISEALHLDGEVPPYRIVKESLDARRKDRPHFVYQIDVDLPWDEKAVKRLKNKNITWKPAEQEAPPVLGTRTMHDQPIVIGAGPAGLFAAYELALHGYQPLLLEQGEPVEARSATVDHFLATGTLNPMSNVQFGEGGAGTFSDGKLTSRSKNPLNRRVLEIFANHGAPAEIRYTAKPHVGTDLLKDVLVRMRHAIEAAGGTIHFNTHVTDVLVENGRVTGVATTAGIYAAELVVLAIGHSARPLFDRLHAQGIAMEAKPFAVGFRIEHPQTMIDRVQYHGYPRSGRLGAASYQLTWHDEASGRGVYTFCMCPGGRVIGAASEAGCLAVNGMSYHARDLTNANSAVLVNITPNDFGSHPLAGVRFQEQVEEACYHLGGGGYVAPVQRVGDFLRGVASTGGGAVIPSVQPGYAWRDLSHLYSSALTDALRRGIVGMEGRLSGFALEDAVLTGVESRSSSPVRIMRDNISLESLNVQGLYPTGEGAGYAGGIVSSAIDGLIVARKIMANRRPF